MGQGVARPVTKVTQNGMAHVSQLTTNLVVPARFQEDFHKACLVRRIQNPVLKPRLLARAARLILDDGRKFPSTNQMMAEFSLWRAQGSFHDGPVDFGGFLFAELRTDSSCRFGGSAEKDHSRYGTVQPVNETQKDLSRLFMAEFDPLLAQIQQGRVVRRIFLNEQTCGLVHGEQMVVMVDHGPLGMKKICLLHSL